MHNKKYEKMMATRQVELTCTNYAVRRIFKNTLRVFREACAFIMKVVLEHWDEISAVGEEQKRLNVVETLIHKTKDNPSPAYRDFDALFYKFPSYYRRSAINFCVGAVSSYLTRLESWQEKLHDANAGGRKFREKPPVLTAVTNCCPALYKGQCYKEGRNDGQIRVKVYVRRTWDWIDVSVSRKDMRSLTAGFGAVRKICSPLLQFKHDKFYLAFPIEYKRQKFPDIPISSQTVLSVDSGINRGAVCSVVDCKGKVYARFFDPFRSERADIEHMLGVIRELSRKSGTEQSLASAYEKLDGLKKNYSNQLSHWIVSVAAECKVYGIVFEHLGNMKGRARGKLAERVHHWTKKRVMDLTKGMASRICVRTFFINPKNTSALAFDGSGKVTRDRDNYSLCTFASGKRYHADLSASYNIAARYFIRAMEREASLSDSASERWKRLKAEVPELAKRTDCTLSTLWKVSAVPAA